MTITPKVTCKATMKKNGKPCTYTALPNMPFCGKHKSHMEIDDTDDTKSTIDDTKPTTVKVEVTMCKATMKNGNKCRYDAVYNEYCGHHKNQTQVERLGKCIGYLKTGHKCNNSAKTGGLCGVHLLKK